jgi:hypothetical protein
VTEECSEALRRLGVIQCPVCAEPFDDTTSPHGVETRVSSVWKGDPLPYSAMFETSAGCNSGPDASPWVCHKTCSPDCARVLLWKLKRDHDVPGAEYRIVQQRGT